jgi:phosphonoacetate hydrolase
MKPKVVLVVCDGLRPDRIDPVRTPALWRLRREGAWYPNSRTVFPSETRVAAASLVTGARPGEHGLLANDFYDPEIFPDRPVATAKAEDLARVARVRGRLLARPTLAERLAQAGMRYAVASTASEGTSRILATGAQPPGGFVWSVHPSVATPPAARAEVEDRFGPLPAPSFPNTSIVEYAARVFTEYVLPLADPDLAIFWSTEPDSTYHYCGIGSPQSAMAEAAADRAVASILEWRERSGEAQRIQVVVTSDHGHITGTERLDVASKLRQGRWPVASGIPGAGEIVVVPGAATFVYASARAARMEKELIRWLKDQPWFGAAFARDGTAGTATIESLGLGHQSQPDLIFTLRHSDGVDALGIPGTGCYDADLLIGAGVHGGLHPRELANVLILSGSAIRSGVTISGPAGLLDLAPTILALLGLQTGETAGRVLREALCNEQADAVETRSEMLLPAASSGAGGLLRSRHGSAIYLDGLAVVSRIESR